MAQKFLNGIDVSSTTVVNGSNLDSGSTVLDVQGSQGQLFSVTNSLTGDLFSVSDISGIPILNVNSSGAVDIDGALTINGGDVKIVKQNDAPILTLLHDGTNTVANDLLFRMQFQSDYDGTHQNWGKIELDTNNSAVRTNMDFYVKSASGAEQLALRLEGQPSASPNAIFEGSVTATSLDINGDADISGVLTLGTALADAEIASAATWNAKQDALTSSSTVLDGRYYTETESNSLYTRKYTFSPGAGVGNRRYIKLFTINDYDSSVVGKLSSAGDYGDSDRASYEIQIATRNNISFDIYQLSTDAVSDDYEFFYKTVGSTYEIWCKMGDYNQDNTFTKFSEYGTVAYNFDSSTQTEPTGLTAVTKAKIYHEGHLPTLTELGAQASGSYLTSYSETDTLDSVADRGATTNQALTIGANATAGGRILSQNYSGLNRLGVISSNSSSGNLLLGYGAEGKVSGGNAFVSTYGNFSGGHSALQISGTTLKWYADASDSETTIGDDLTMVNVFEVDRSGDAIFGGTVTANGTVLTGTQTTVSGSSGSCTGNAATATTATNSTQLNTFTLDRIDNAEAFHTLTALNADGQQAKRYHIGRLYGCPAHWDGNWQNLEIRATAESYESGHMIWRILGDYGGAGTQAGMMDLYLKEATGPMCNRFNITLGTPVDAGWDHSGQDTYYVDLYVEAAYYSQWEVNIKTYGHGTQNTNPTSGGATTVIYDSPSSSNISDFNLTHATIKHLDYEIYHEGHIPTFAEITTPTTIAGYGITDSLVIGTTSTTAMAGNTAIPTDHGDHDGLYLPIGGGILTGDLKINTQIGFQRDGANYSNYIKSSQYGSEGYDDSGTPPDDRYWLEYGAKGGHHFVLNTDGGTGSAENAYDDFTIWQGEVDGDRLFEVTNAGNTSITGGVKVLGSIESRKNIVSNANYNIAQISSTRTTDDYGGLNKTYAKLDIQTPGPNTDGTSSAHGLAHLSIKLADNAGNSDLVQKALLRHDSELILGGFYPQTTETELAGLTIRSRYAGSDRNFLRFQTDHSTTTTEWTMAKIYAGDGGAFNGKMYFQVATGSNSSTSYNTSHDQQLETAMFIDDDKSVTFYGNITASSATAHFSIVNASAYQLNGTYIVDSSRNLVNISKLRFGSSDAVIDTGEATSATATTVVSSVTHGTYNAAFFDYVIKNGANVRAGTVTACHNGASTPLVEFTETSTVDLGDTSDVTLSVVINGTTMDLQATTTSSTWTIKTLIRVI